MSKFGVSAFTTFTIPCCSLHWEICIWTSILSQGKVALAPSIFFRAPRKAVLKSRTALPTFYIKRHITVISRAWLPIRDIWITCTSIQKAPRWLNHNTSYWLTFKWNYAIFTRHAILINRGLRTFTICIAIMATKTRFFRQQFCIIQLPIFSIAWTNRRVVVFTRYYFIWDAHRTSAYSSWWVPAVHFMHAALCLFKTALSGARVIFAPTNLSTSTMF